MKLNLYTLSVLAYGVTAIKLSSEAMGSVADGLLSATEIDSEFDLTCLAQQDCSSTPAVAA